MKKIISFLILLSVLCIFAGCGRTVNPLIEKKIVSAVRSHIKAEKWDCKLLGDPNLVDVKMPDINLSGTNISYKNANIDKVDLHFKNLTYNIHTKSIKSCEEATADIKIKDSDLTKIIREYITIIDSPAVIAKDDNITIKGETEILSLNVNLEVTGSLYIKHGTEIILEPKSFKVMKLGVVIPNIAKKIITDKINPVYSLKDNPYGIYINDFHYSKGYFYAKGKFDSVKIMEIFKDSSE